MSENHDRHTTGDQSGQHAGTAATENPAGGGPGERHEVGAAASRREPPHPTENDEHSPVDSPALPANAAGRDRLSTREQEQGIDEESAYDRRESEDKDQPPSAG